MRIADAIDFLRRRPALITSAGGAVLAIIVAALWSGTEHAEVSAQAPVQEGSAVSLRGLPRPASGPDSMLSPAANADDECGIASPTDRADALTANIAAADAALVKLATELAGRSADRERALGLYLQMIEQGGPAAARGRLGELVRVATTTSDAAAYAMAIYSCVPLGGQTFEECGLLNVQQWARLEPDNAVPWLYLAGEAERRTDQRAMEAALFQASKASYSDAHLDQVAGVFASEQTATLTADVQVDLAGSLNSIQGGLPHPPLTALRNYCGAEMKLHPDRTQVCGDLAANLIEHGHTVIEVLAAGHVADQIGWADPRLAALHDEVDAMRWQVRGDGRQREYGVLPGCRSTRKLRDFMTARGEVGEAQQLREALSIDGVTMTQAAQRWRKAPRRW